MAKLSGRQRSELAALAISRGLWSGVEPYQSDADLDFYLCNGLVKHLGAGKGYAITEAGRTAIATEGGGR